MEEIENVLAMLNTPTANPSARSAMVSSEISDLAGKVGGLIDETQSTISSLNGMSNLSPEAAQARDNLAAGLQTLVNGLTDVQKTCQDFTKNQ